MQSQQLTEKTQVDDGHIPLSQTKEAYTFISNSLATIVDSCITSVNRLTDMCKQQCQQTALVHSLGNYDTLQGMPTQRETRYDSKTFENMSVKASQKFPEDKYVTQQDTQENQAIIQQPLRLQIKNKNIFSHRIYHSNRLNLNLNRQKLIFNKNKGSKKGIKLIKACQKNIQRPKNQANYIQKKSDNYIQSICLPDKFQALENNTKNKSMVVVNKKALVQLQQNQQYLVNDSIVKMHQFVQKRALSNTPAISVQSSGPVENRLIPLNIKRAVISKQGKLMGLKLSSLNIDTTAVSKMEQYRFPMRIDDFLKYFYDLMWQLERKEAVSHDLIYFFPILQREKNKLKGTNAHKIPDNQYKMDVRNYKTNNIYDMNTIESISQPNEHLHYRYEVIKKLGEGSFGVVLKCFDHKTKSYVGLKILKNEKQLYEQGLAEAKLVKQLNDWDKEDKKNIVRIIDQFVFREHLIITFELLSLNLYELIKIENFQGLSLDLIKRFAIQILISLYFLSEHKIIHCDLKPENILLRKIGKTGIKIIDFGSSCVEGQNTYTYTQSRFYRAPEIVLGIPYNAAIDMWSFGCILYEMYTGHPLFPGEDEKEHMALMMEVNGIPPRSVLARSTRREVFFDEEYKPIITHNSEGRARIPATKNLNTLMNCNDKNFIEFIKQCIEWKPEKRLTPQQAFSAPFIYQAVGELKRLEDFRLKSVHLIQQGLKPSTTGSKIQLISNERK